ncbi:MAG: PAS domain S-box protein [Dehalogenimonas sp.]
MEVFKILYFGNEDENVRKALEAANVNAVVERIADLAFFYKHLKENQFNVILSQYPLANVSVSEIIGTRDRLTPDTPLIIITGKTIQNETFLTSIAGIADIIPNVEITRLAVAIQNAISGSLVKRKHWEVTKQFNEQTILNEKILNAIPYPIMLIKPNTYEIVTTNRMASKIGVNPGDICYRAWANQDKPCAWCLAPKLWETGSEQHCEVEWNNHWWEAHWIPVDNQHYMHYIIDITERKNSEIEKSKLDSYIETLVQNLPIGIALNTIDDGKAVFMNHKFEEIYGWSRDVLTDVETFFEKVYPDDAYRLKLQKRVTEDIQSNDTSKMRWDNLMITTSSGAQRYISAANIPLLEQNLMISTVRDVTERIKAESATKLRATLLDAVSDSVFLSEIEGNIIYCNEQGYKSRGYQQNELIGTNIKILRPSTESSDWDEKRQLIIESGESTYESMHRCKNGSVFPVEIHSRSLNHDGKTLILSVVRDITKRRQRALEQRELRDKAEMSSRLAAIGEMAAGIAHEINNPLTGVHGFSELLMERKELPDDVMESLRIIYDGSERVKDIVKRMLTFSRQSEPTRSSIDIHQLLDNTLALRSYVLNTSNVEVIKDYDLDLPWIPVDAGQLQQVFLNLIINAEYAIKKAQRPGKLVIKTENVDGQVQISISDDGIGMSEATISKLFQPFFTTKEPGEGTGLGLSVSRAIVLEHGGTITASSTLNQGTSFKIKLPIVQTEADTAQAELNVQQFSSGEKAQILVVDDELTVRAFIKTVLSAAGHIVEECDRPNQVFDRLNSKEFDAILLDIRMPGTSGTEIYKKLGKTHPEMIGRIIFITGDISDNDTRAFLASHDIPYLTKPFTKIELQNKISDILRSKSS